MTTLFGHCTGARTSSYRPHPLHSKTLGYLKDDIRVFLLLRDLLDIGKHGRHVLEFSVDLDAGVEGRAVDRVARINLRCRERGARRANGCDGLDALFDALPSGLSGQVGPDGIGHAVRAQLGGCKDVSQG